ncbi:flagellar basal body P-ring formation protein FlgA [Thermosipho ferrireducens]|uniref:Flagellar basal body P-ring formation protein FlgA n=1 Tax=Thermosipho ferrireducens TaxID=2571116 RepID=A0ABX7S6T4_9BACT|nr:flagellar basal body P-ring formation chaperone FlgA [Thermosipho ferrireducens]QTA38284.1 flagellar basal body P-ring formation protein FlgA [Thermosipho ferrireducens]
MKKFFLFLAFLGQAIVLGAYIEFLPFATVTTNVVTVYDVSATYVTFDATTLRNIILAYIPENGKIDISVKYILQRLSRVTSDIEATPTEGFISVSYSPVVVSESTSSTLTVEKAYKMAKNLVLSSLPEGAYATITSSYGTIVEHDNYSIKLLGGAVGNFLVRFSLKKSGRTVGYYNINLKAELFRKIPVAARNINYGEQVTDKDIIRKSVNILSLHGTPVNVSELPMIARKSFKEGEAILKEYLDKIPDVVTGQLLIGIVELPGVKVTALLRAMEDGNIGDVIKARNVDTGKLVYGIIVKGPLLRVLEVLK